MGGLGSGLRSRYCTVCNRKIPDNRYAAKAKTCSSPCQRQVRSERSSSRLRYETEVHQCQLCGRAFSGSLLKRGKCTVCSETPNAQVTLVVPYNDLEDLRHEAHQKGLRVPQLLRRLIRNHNNQARWRSDAS